MIAALALLWASACSLAPVDLEGRRCPCADGWTCDEATDTCVRGGGVDGGRRDAGRTDAGRVDAGRVDAGRIDAGRIDAGPVLPDAGAMDAGPPGACPAAVEPRSRVLSAYRHHTCAVRSGEVWCWGLNDFGQLGNGGPTTPIDFCGLVAVEPLPVRAGSESVWTQVAAGQEHTCALRNDGTVWCWGDNDQGQLGTGDRTDRGVPTPVTGVAGRRFVDLAAGSRTNCAVDDAGGLWCWGDNTAGEVGRGMVTDFELVPLRIGADDDWAQVGLGGYHSCGLKRDGQLWCWGGTDCSQTGVSPPGHPLAPRREGDGCWTSLHANDKYTCVRDARGGLRCIGGNAEGVLGRGFVGAPMIDGGPAPGGADVGCWPPIAELDEAAPDLPPIRAAAGGTLHGCAVTTGGELWCWGYGQQCQLGRTPPDGRRDPMPGPVGESTDWVATAVGFFHSCAMQADGAVYCFGDGCRGLLGTGSETGTCTPTMVATLPPR